MHTLGEFVDILDSNDQNKINKLIEDFAIWFTDLESAPLSDKDDAFNNYVKACELLKAFGLLSDWWSYNTSCGTPQAFCAGPLWPIIEEKAKEKERELNYRKPLAQYRLADPSNYSKPWPS
jgi:hypothetical protein